MSLERVFSTGMAYVALSRGRSLDGIHLVNYDVKGIVADKKVIEFYKSLPGQLERAQSALPPLAFASCCHVQVPQLGQATPVADVAPLL